MVEYFYSWIPLVVIGAILLLTLPWLGLIALVVGALVVLLALAALASAIVVVPYRISRAIAHRWHGRVAPSPRTAAVLTPASPRRAAAHGRDVGF